MPALDTYDELASVTPAAISDGTASCVEVLA